MPTFRPSPCNSLLSLVLSSGRTSAITMSILSWRATAAAIWAVFPVSISVCTFNTPQPDLGNTTVSVSVPVRSGVRLAPICPALGPLGDMNPAVHGKHPAVHPVQDQTRSDQHQQQGAEPASRDTAQSVAQTSGL